jgi:hypothetical protein
MSKGSISKKKFRRLKKAQGKNRKKKKTTEMLKVLITLGVGQFLTLSLKKGKKTYYYMSFPGKMHIKAEL